MDNQPQDKEVEVSVKSLDTLKGMIDEAVAKHAEKLEKFQTKFNVNPTATNEKKVKAAAKFTTTVKFLNALKSEDMETVKQLHIERAKALNEGTGSAGGFLVPEEFERSLIEAFDDFSEIRRDSTVVTMNSDIKNLNELTGKVTVYKTAELVAATASQSTYGEPVLTAEKYMGSVTLSEELIEDSELDIISNISRQFGEQFGYKEQDSFINSAVSGSEGLLVVSGVTNISLITGSTFTAITWDDLAAMHKEAFEYNKAEANRGKFYMSMTAYNALRTLKATGDGNYFNMPAVPTQANPASAWGRPIVVLNEMPQTTATATKFVVFADLKQHLFIGDRRGIRVKVHESGTSADGTNLNTKDAREMVVTKRTAQVTALESGIITLSTN